MKITINFTKIYIYIIVWVENQIHKPNYHYYLIDCFKHKFLLLKKIKKKKSSAKVKNINKKKIITHP